MCTVKVFQLTKTCSEVISGGIFRPHACSVMFVCNRMDSAREYVRNCGERLKGKENKEITKLKPAFVFPNVNKELKQSTPERATW